MTSSTAKYWGSGDVPMIGPDILGGILTSVSDVGMVITETGIIQSVLLNPDFSEITLFEHAVGTAVPDLLTVESKPKFDSRLTAFLDGSGPVRPLEVNHIRHDGPRDLPVRYSFHRIGQKGAILMLGQDLRPIAEMQQQLVSSQLALEQDYESQRDFETRFRVVLDSAREGIVLVSAHSGEISDANTKASSVLAAPSTTLIGKTFLDFFEPKSEATLLDRLMSEATRDTAKSVSAKRADGTTLTVEPKLFRSAGERILLCRMSESDHGSPDDQHSQLLRGLHDTAPDGIVFTDDEGTILSVNEGFLNLIGTARNINVSESSLADILQRGMVDFGVMTQNARRAGYLRSYTTRIASDYGSPREVDMAVSCFQAGDSRVFAFVMRDASHPDRTPDTGSRAELSSVVELVGSSNLRDIVSETTNVVEKMCIETAIELTANNRVAAAEMLGLSRQSLYVKLRKFGLINQGGD